MQYFTYCCNVCNLFCCPPCPAKITSKLAFLPPNVSYEFTNPHNSVYSINLFENSKWMFNENERKCILGSFTQTKLGNQIACVFVNCVRKPKFIILFSHTNATDIGMTCNLLVFLGLRLQCNIFSYDYSGYGLSSGRPSEKNLYADIDAAWNELHGQYNVNPNQVILYGQSIGTVPTVNLASRESFAGVILHSPLMSCLRVAFPNLSKTNCFDAFRSIDLCSKITSPVLVIHGLNDQIIDFHHGYMIHQNCPNTVTPLWVDGGGHNDLELHNIFWERLSLFVDNELPTLIFTKIN